VFSAADLIDVLRHRRTLRSIRPETPGEFPPGWQSWLEAIRPLRHGVTGAPAPALVAVFLERPLRDPPRAGAILDRWQAFASLWRQQWNPPTPDERGPRIAGMATTGVVHLVLAVLLVWLMDARFLVLPPEREGEAVTVQVEWIGRGTPEEPGAGAPADEEAAQDAPAAAAEPRATPGIAAAEPVEGEPVPTELPVPQLPQPEVAIAPRTLAVESPPLREREIPTPAPPVAAQPVQVTDVEVPDTDFVLPPPTPRMVVVPPTVATPDLELAPPSVRDLSIPEPAQTPTPAIRMPEFPRVALPTPESSDSPAAARRDIPEPAQDPVPRTPALPAPRVAAPSLPAVQPGAVTAREIPVPDAGPPGSAAAVPGSAATTPSEGTATTEAARPGSGPPASPGATRPAAQPGTALVPGLPPGAPATTSRGDDWGEALRQRPGGREAGPPGLFDESGRPRLADAPGARAGGAPPGSVEERIGDLDRAGTWLQRPPYGYEPTRFDRYWIPGGTLLEEWVRRGVRNVSIPIPGTNKRLACVVSVLQLGGGCGVVDPNLNEQPATARPPPDIPFRPDLFEDPDALGPPGGG
jgi:hypothetical protein